MRHTRMIFVLASASLAIWACSSPAPGPGSSNTSSTDPTTGSGSRAGSKAPSTASTTPTNGAAPAPSSSAATSDDGSGDACSDACDQKHAHGAQTMAAADQAFTACLCVASVCQSACAATDCADPAKPPAEGDACDTCENGAAAVACGAKSESACQADPDCAALTACYDACVPDAGD